jgi:hypothetical protein
MCGSNFGRIHVFQYVHGFAIKRSPCPPNFTHLFFTICEIITFKVDEKVFFPYANGG